LNLELLIRQLPKHLLTIRLSCLASSTQLDSGSFLSLVFPFTTRSSIPSASVQKRNLISTRARPRLEWNRVDKSSDIYDKSVRLGNRDARTFPLVSRCSARPLEGLIACVGPGRMDSPPHANDKRASIMLNICCLVDLANSERPSTDQDCWRNRVTTASLMRNYEKGIACSFLNALSL
jgi:hypothetical protein